MKIELNIETRFFNHTVCNFRIEIKLLFKYTLIKERYIYRCVALKLLYIKKCCYWQTYDINIRKIFLRESMYSMYNNIYTFLQLIWNYPRPYKNTYNFYKIKYHNKSSRKGVFFFKLSGLLVNINEFILEMNIYIYLFFKCYDSIYYIQILLKCNLYAYLYVINSFPNIWIQTQQLFLTQG